MRAKAHGNVRLMTAQGYTMSKSRMDSEVNNSLKWNELHVWQN